ncbi:MAG: TolC family protein [Desulfobulbaceae bacterium]|uniref:TolC family protein n=1 Tax=Candidatus Desulfobia pelagia TaxID=2841692 RepID=A0A8J6NFE9_9BACT|nr:TolC family protein [Candidatus Desulfobia pelagia]
MYEKLFKTGTRLGAGTFKSVCNAIGLILLCGIVPALAGTPDTVLSEQDVLRIGLDRPEVLQHVKSSIDLAESDIIEAGTWENPEFSYDQESSNDGPDDITSRSYMLSQKVTGFGQRDIKTEAARKRLDAVTQEMSQWRLERTTDIRQKFYAVLYQQQLHDVFAKWRSGMDAMEMVMQKRMEAGDISGYDLDRLKREQSFVRAGQRQAHAEHDRMTQELLATIGLIGDVSSLPGVTGNLLPETPLPPLEKLLEKIAEQPDLLAMKLQSKAYAIDERLAQRWWLQDITLGMGVKDIENAEGDALLFKISLPIPVFNRNSRALHQAKASRLQQQNKYNLVLSERQGIVRGLWHQASELTEAVRPLTEEDCQSLVESAEIAYKAGEIGALEILDAYRISFENQAQILSIMREARMVRIELDLITGGNTQ